MQGDFFFDRDVSWLSFNGRVLAEAGNDRVPLLERIRFLSIYSSNLDEFYRVRMPAIMALKKINQSGDDEHREEYPGKAAFHQILDTINRQQEQFGIIFSQQVLPLLQQHEIYLLYNEPLPEQICDSINGFFFTQVLAFLQLVHLQPECSFFPGNNKLYLLTVVEYEPGKENLVILNVPSDNLSRFYCVRADNRQYVVFLDDIIKNNLQAIFKQAIVKGCYSFKITRDAELDLHDEYEGDLADKIEKLVTRRDLGLATRLLHEPGIAPQHLQSLISILKLQKAVVVQGGRYHNLKDLASFPVKDDALSYPAWPAISMKAATQPQSLFEQIAKKDIICHAPYQTYDTILRFFNEAAIDSEVTEVYVTLYRVASESRIAHALASAAKNGKKVTVLVELKARFDEKNNIRWAKKMKAAGVKIIYSAVTLKVHAKIALVKRKKDHRVNYFGLLATGNLNESTARFYTDHILFTARHSILRELELLFIFLGHGKKAGVPGLIPFDHLLVSQFNGQQRFLALIDREIANVRAGLPASIIIKINNLEEKVLISKLYEASRAGVQINMIVRTICCLVPGVKDMSEHITITRIVDRYLEHGRIFVFHNNGQQEVYMGSADWMNRNIYRRIEVCFPLYDETIKQEMLDILQVQLKDNVQAVTIDSHLNNKPVEAGEPFVRSQEVIYKLLAGKVN